MSNETTLDDVLALVAKATPGEWLPDTDREAFPNEAFVNIVGGYIEVGGSRSSRESNANAIAAAVNYLRAHGDELRAALEDARRLYWLIETYSHLVMRNGMWAVSVGGVRPAHDCHDPRDSIDAAIDAMAAGGGHE